MALGGKRPGAGRPKGSLTAASLNIAVVARQHGPEAINTLYKIMMNGENDANRIAAAKELLDRGYGKAPQPLAGYDAEQQKLLSAIEVRIVAHSED